MKPILALEFVAKFDKNFNSYKLLHFVILCRGNFLLQSHNIATL